MSPSNLIFAGRRYKCSTVRRRDSIRRSCLQSNFMTSSLDGRLPGPSLFIDFLVHARSIARHILRTVPIKAGRGSHTLVISSVSALLTRRTITGSALLHTRVAPFCNNGRFCLSICGSCCSIHLIFTPPSSMNGFNKSASG